MADSSSGSSKSVNLNIAKKVPVPSADFRQRSDEDAELCSCDTVCHDLQIGMACNSNNPPHCNQGSTVTISAPTRKAEREKLRRDRLNEQLLELAGALGETDRQKNDKSTILGDAIQTLKELMADVEHLRAEHSSLLEESKDLGQEKNEMYEEKHQLMLKVQQLQSQACQQIYSMLLWRTADPANTMGGYGSSLPSMHGAIQVDAHPRPPPIQVPLVGIQSVPLVHAPMAVHPRGQAYYGCAGQSAPYFPMPFAHMDAVSSQIEERRNWAHGYLPQVQQVLAHDLPAVTQAASQSQPYTSCYLLPMPAVSENQNTSCAGRMSSSAHREHCIEPFIREHHTNKEHHRPTLQLQSPVNLSLAKPRQRHGAADKREQNETNAPYKESSSTQHKRS